MARNILVTNDDGIGAEGIETLFALASQFGNVVLVAPAEPQSGCSHVITAHQAVRFEQARAGQFVAHGTPADCVRLALLNLPQQFDLVLSGINHGGNLGADIFCSGTVAAAREARLHGIPSVALSHYRAPSREFDWQRAAELVTQVLHKILDQPLQAGEYWNVNLPHHPDVQPELIECPVDPHPHPLVYESDDLGWKYAGIYHERPRLPESDLEVCFAGHVAISRLRTH